MNKQSKIQEGQLKWRYPQLSTLLLWITLVFVSNCQYSTTSSPPLSREKDTISITVLSDTIIPQPIGKRMIIDYDTTRWCDVHHIDSRIQIDMRYATTDNFVETQMYDCSRCFLRPEVAYALTEAQTFLEQKGFGLKMLDCYRPHPVQQLLWDKMPDAHYVTPPQKGSMHNKGLAVDVTLTNAKGEELDMGTPFDFFGKKAYQTYMGLPDSILYRRKLLRETMHQFGFRHIRTEWWHYSYRKARYPISDYEWNCD